MVTETIAAIATPPGIGGVGIIRISGPLCQDIAKKLLGKLPKARQAMLSPFKDQQQQILDTGIALYFPKPHSFTGEDVLELQGHGGPVVLDMLLQTILHCGARLAQPGEFSQRAFLNGKMDLVQAEAVADLIESRSQAAARSAFRSLQGDFSKQIAAVLQQLIHLRTYIEAAIDFPEEEVDFLSDGKVEKMLQELQSHCQQIFKQAKQGQVLNEGLRLAIVGEPNVGKSSLLNKLAQQEVAIVTEIPGTTRDVLRETIIVAGIPFTVVDTAGLRHTEDHVEREGIRRAQAEIDKADVILYLIDASQEKQDQQQIESIQALQKKLVIIYNKIDLKGQAPKLNTQADPPTLHISVKQELGLDLLQQCLQHFAGVEQQESLFTARRRHLRALEQTLQHIDGAFQEMGSGEIMAEELRLAQKFLSEITGEFTSDDLLGEIFSNFCIGK